MKPVSIEDLDRLYAEGDHATIGLRWLEIRAVLQVLGDASLQQAARQVMEGPSTVTMEKAFVLNSWERIQALPGYEQMEAARDWMHQLAELCYLSNRGQG